MAVALSPIVTLWQNFALGLRLKMSTTDIIRTEAKNPHDCLREVLKHWLRRDYNTHRFGPPTWRRIVEVVASPSGCSNPALAHRIAHEHPGKALF